jgi:tetratricopeptide (TPR) repeat protein
LPSNRSAVVVFALVMGVTSRARAASDEPAAAPEQAAATTQQAAAAPPQPAATPERPWAENVSEDAQKTALALFEEGNKLFGNGQHAVALAKYREALKVWDHPAIRYNVAVALINLDQPLAAYENLEPALRYGAAPLGAETYQQALTYRKLLRGQLAELKVTCAEQGAEVALDGQALFVGPGEASRWISPGPHELVARKSGFLTETRSLSLLPGKSWDENLALQDIRSLPVKTVRRWATWKPWAVVGAGALVALIGIPVILDAQSNFDAYDAAVAACVTQNQMNGCPANTVSQSALDRGHLENTIAVSLFAVGGAVAASGVALLILNLPRVAPVDEATHASVVPLLGPGVFGLSLALSR